MLLCSGVELPPPAGHKLTQIEEVLFITFLRLLLSQTLQMGISHFSGLFVLLCVGVSGALLTLAGEHGFYRLVLPHIRRRQKLKYWLHTSQVPHSFNTHDSLCSSAGNRTSSGHDYPPFKNLEFYLKRVLLQTCFSIFSNLKHL